jgi:hypothetical protein
MEIGVAVVVIVVIFAVLALAGFVVARVRKRKEEQNRLEAAEHRHEAEIRSASAERREAEASERAARARHEEAQAREQAARAQQDREVAEERRIAADRIDPDVASRGRADNRPAGANSADSPRDGDPAVRTDRVNLGNGHGAQAAPDPAGRTDRINLDERSPQNVDPASRTDRMNFAGREEHGPASTTGAAHKEQTAVSDVAREGTGREASGPATRDVGRSAVGGTEPGRADVPAGAAQAGRSTAEHSGREGEAAPPTTASLPSQRGGEHDQSSADLDPAGQCTIPPRPGQADPAHDQGKDTDRGPVRAIADRLLGRGR